MYSKCLRASTFSLSGICHCCINYKWSNNKVFGSPPFCYAKRGGCPISQGCHWAVYWWCWPLFEYFLVCKHTCAFFPYVMLSDVIAICADLLFNKGSYYEIWQLIQQEDYVFLLIWIKLTYKFLLLSVIIIFCTSFWRKVSFNIFYTIIIYIRLLVHVTDTVKTPYGKLREAKNIDHQNRTE